MRVSLLQVVESYADADSVVHAGLRGALVSNYSQKRKTCMLVESSKYHCYYVIHLQ